ncbi:two-component system%2C NtrC family%2C phosphoglycerate transport system sensor histidine kinase PgtB [Vibrio cholerae]|nr:two-component system%2C NtrC family%2C phosphoglycerate transport system sensor histidine kinase PgtB [Vibrio cholerae]
MDELLKAKHLTQVDNGMRVLQYRLDELRGRFSAKPA